MVFSALIVPLELVEKEGISKEEFWCYVEELHARRIQNLNQELRSVERVFSSTLEWLNITHRAQSRGAAKTPENIFREVVSFFERQRDPNLPTPTSSDTYVVLCWIAATDTHFVAPRSRPPVAVFIHRVEPTGASLFSLGQKSQLHA